ncbi:hypothetical protein HNR46_004151 [Haloferula luteola]|uniref:Uncharacterized protein n=1 Tax=Haloferula luteola TaxID=595692 RepID=A0A840V6J8_9BACT|nr:hypothetical protein [Haloferula luteola]
MVSLCFFLFRPNLEHRLTELGKILLARLSPCLFIGLRPRPESPSIRIIEAAGNYTLPARQLLIRNILSVPSKVYEQ